MIALSALFISACDTKAPVEVPINQEELHSEKDSSPAQKLIDVAGQAAIPQDEAETQINIPEIAKPYVGRYRTKVNCSDKIVYCDKGSADVILNLLPNGTAHRAIIHLGKVTFSSNELYRQDYWFYDEKNNEIVVERDNGVQLFFEVDPTGKLIMNATKVLTATERNRKFYESRENPKPIENYVLIKEKSLE